MPKLEKGTQEGLRWIEEEIHLALSTNDRKHLEKVKKELSRLNKLAADHEARIIVAQQENQAGNTT